MAKRIITYQDAVREALSREMEANPAVFMIGEDIGVYGGAFGVTAGLIEKFGCNRLVQSPISENSLVGFGIGAALTGLRPVVEIMFMDFITLAMDQLVNHAAKIRYMYGGQARVPLVIRTPAGGGKAYGASHSQCLESWFMHVPGLNVVTPSTPYNAKGLLTEALRRDEPTLFVEHKLLYPKKGYVPKKGYTVGFGNAEVVREGGDVTVVTYSKMVWDTLEAARLLADEDGIEAEIIDLQTLSPLDMETVLESFCNTGRLAVVEEGVRTGGVGAEIAARAAETAVDCMDAPVLRIGAPDAPITFSPTLEDEYIPGPQRIRRELRALVEGGV